MFCVKDTLEVLSFGIVFFLCEILENTTLIIDNLSEINTCNFRHSGSIRLTFTAMCTPFPV